MSVHIRCDHCHREYSPLNKQRWLAMTGIASNGHSILSFIDQWNYHATVCSGECALHWLTKQGFIISTASHSFYPLTYPLLDDEALLENDSSSESSDCL